MFEHVRHQQGFLEKLWFIYGQRLHRWMISKHAHFYLKPNDIISHRPALFGFHEPHIEKLIKASARNYGDFLIDLGANIGLISALTGQSFKRVDCVEPNGLVANILKTNLALNLSDTNYHIHQIGLGHKQEVLRLKIPVDNFGGAFVEQNNPQFDQNKKSALLDQRDKKSGFYEADIKIEPAGDWLEKIFAAYHKNQFYNGVIKIDVEGYEEIIFSQIIEKLPEDFSVIIIMENWFDHFPVSKFISDTHDIEWFYFKKTRRFFHSIPFKLLGLSSSYEQTIEQLMDTTPHPHDVVCLLNPKKG